VDLYIYSFVLKRVGIHQANNNNNNNNNNNKLQLGCHPVAVDILHVRKYEISIRTFKSAGLHEKHVVANWKLHVLEGNWAICFNKFQTVKKIVYYT
jgi:hypothetical protein